MTYEYAIRETFFSLKTFEVYLGAKGMVSWILLQDSVKWPDVFVYGVCGGGGGGELIGFASGLPGATSCRIDKNLYLTYFILLCLSQVRGLALVPAPLSST